jgi:hypothetical protein
MPSQNQPEIMHIRGVPIETREVFLQQERLGAQLFDECMFMNSQKKRLACANVIVELDRKFAESVAKSGPLGKNEIRTLDIGDPSWYYIPVMLINPAETNVIVMPTKDRPAGLVAWFRIKRYHRGVTFEGGVYGIFFSRSNKSQT